MKLTVFCIVAIFLVLAFAGVAPLTEYKDAAFGQIASVFTSIGKQSTVSTPKPTPTQTPTPTPKPAPTSTPTKSLTLEYVEKQTFDLINQERIKAGLKPTIWDDKLYTLSKSHTEDMANKGELFHTPMGASYGENAWGASWGRISKTALALEIVNSWMSSPLHRAWILHIPLRTSVVSIVDDNRGQYASWTFWTVEAEEGPPLIQRAYDLWQSETGGNIPWLTWLYDVKGYPDNQEFLKQLGVIK